MVKSKRMMMGILVVLTIFIAGMDSNAAEKKAGKKVKNLIVLIPDGMSAADTTIARWYNGGAPLAMDELACGLVRTYWAGGPITDSAPAATAFASGIKSGPGFVGVWPDKADIYGVEPIPSGMERSPAATVLEAAKLKGKATGIVATSNVQHATPAGYTSHFYDRGRYDILGEQQVYNNINVVFGAGYKYLAAESRKDGENLFDVLKEKGYTVVRTKDEMKAFEGKKIYGLFADDAMAYEMDREENAKSEPSLDEMTKKAIEVLSKDKDGFFLMVEGSKVDWAAHANDPIGIISDVLAFDKAVKTALEFAKADGNTAIVIISDHGNGGMTLGNKETSNGYDKAPLSKFIDPLKKAVLTGEGIEKKFDAEKTNIKEVMEKYYGIKDLSEDEIKAIKEAKAGSMNYTVGAMISKRAFIGWTTNGHTGEDLTLYAYHPNGYIPRGVIQNTDIAKYSAEVLGLDLTKTTGELFVNIITEVQKPEAGVTYYTWQTSNSEIDAMWDKIDAAKDETEKQVITAKIKELEAKQNENKTLIVKKGEKTVKLFANKDFYEVDGKMKKSKGVAVYIDNTKFYGSKAVLNDILN